jgi:hypothetical protein
MNKRLIAIVLASFAALGVAVAAPRGSALAVASSNVVSGAGAGEYTAGATFQGIALAGGTYGLGVQTNLDGSAVGDLELQLNGSSLIGLSQWITVTAWITTGTQNADGSMTLNGTGTLDLGDGTAPTGGLPVVAQVSLTGVQVTIGGNAIPTLPKSDGWISIE